MVKKSNRPNWILRIAGVLLCLTMLSVHLTSGMVARYSSTASGTEAARVAKFSVRETGTFSKDLYLEYQPDMSEGYTVIVENKSEVAVHCTLSVERLSNNLPITVTIDGVESEKMTNMDFAPNDTTGMKYNLVVNWDKSRNAASYAGEVDAVRVTLHAVQIN